MKMIHYLFSSPIDFDESNLQQLVFEDPDDMGRMVKELLTQTNGGSGRYSLFDRDKDLNLTKDAVMIESPINLNEIDKKIVQGIVNKAMNVLVGPDLQTETYDILARLELLVSKSMIDVEESVSVGGIDINRVLKSIGIEIDHEDDIMSDLMTVCNLLSRYTNARLIIISNVSRYISIDKRKDLVKGLAYLNVPILVIDSEYIEGYSCKLFDTDFCEIELKNGSGYIFEV